MWLQYARNGKAQGNSHIIDQGTRRTENGRKVGRYPKMDTEFRRLARDFDTARRLAETEYTRRQAATLTGTSVNGSNAGSALVPVNLQGHASGSNREMQRFQTAVGQAVGNLGQRLSNLEQLAVC